MDQFLDESIATCTASDGTVFRSPSSGVPPGLSCSTNMFVDIYGEASEEYENNIKLETNMVMASSLNDDNQMVSTSSTTFVDDMCTTIASRENTQQPSMIQKVDVEIEKSMGTRGMELNQKKVGLLASTYGPNAKKILKILQKDQNVNTQTRYLGPDLHYEGNLMVEVQNRVTAAWKIFREYAQLWSDTSSIRFKINIFMSATIFVLLSGLVS